ncbi:hypothetical protein BMS3Bbin06_00968 [bacterium BMS3Bbin06]|nr:hypothetical protein BMS3Abin08_01567 [bacterium BMS3Abin08]GBE34443.1 hypothetical protein BMS3Bbin06_00968 [bacterium BMS3Bbin06]HDO35475.1 hypothetical protein [Nitrospirota bacterium]HDY70293.1 hypothetical protein [Nitrospirota bacterium]
MRIDDYSFGRIVINGKIYTNDVIIFPEEVFSPWWRKEGHLLHREDLLDVIKNEPGVLIIGRGYSGEMKVPDPLVRELEEMGIRVIPMKTPEAVKKYNDLRDGKAVAALHLTC